MTRGYNVLASFMGAYPEMAIFRRFGALNARNILYLQAEITDLETQLLNAEKSDIESKHQDRSIYSRDWRTLSESLEAADGDSTQWKIFLHLREKLHEYNRAVLEQVQMAKLSPPNLRDLRFLVDYMKVPSMGNIYLLGPDSDIWEKPQLEDMFAVNPKEVDNSLSKMVTVIVVDWFHRLVGWRVRMKKPKDEESTPNTVVYSQVGLERISRVMITAMASSLPILSIVVLYVINSMSKRLAMIGVFTVIFAIVLGFLTSGKPIEIFSATAAFAAVQVVFVGTTTQATLSP
ncbi:hypothetical protein EJ04DRAFT_547840 [Polyplosphaeria fusca]|uniref:DUF6594 domain-containing protein n=1 Tax=Polyplosphaeria fusca TaxID=682080 RepID=A0A9P4RC97_9PLEO|nr:hypothetical protein EJ04DRAFT_547840 [Polyplosphaeria fusca]